MSSLPVVSAYRVLSNALRHPLGRRRKLQTLAAIARWQVRSKRLGDRITVCRIALSDREGRGALTDGRSIR